jgi:hypothetical protein
MDEQEACDRLRQAKLGEGEIAQLQHLRHQYLAEGDKLESLAQYHRLQFVRWLLTTGKLTEQVPNAGGDSMVEGQQFHQVNQATGNVANSFYEASQAFVDTLVTIQDHHLKFAHSFLLNWMELLTQQTQKQQTAFQQLAWASLRVYLDFLLAPFAFSQPPVDAAPVPMQHERKQT